MVPYLLQVLQHAYERESKSGRDSGLQAGQRLSAALMDAVLAAEPSAQFAPLLVSAGLRSCSPGPWLA